VTGATNNRNAKHRKTTQLKNRSLFFNADTQIKICPTNEKAYTLILLFLTPCATHAAIAAGATQRRIERLALPGAVLEGSLLLRLGQRWRILL
jgi:hypothetical protein